VELVQAGNRRRAIRSVRREIQDQRLAVSVVPLRADTLAELIDVAELAADAVHIVHTDFRENIDFTALAAALERLGLLDADGEKIPNNPEEGRTNG
jgi:hypothetical protein